MIAYYNSHVKTAKLLSKTVNGKVLFGSSHYTECDWLVCLIHDLILQPVCDEFIIFLAFLLNG